MKKRARNDAVIRDWNDIQFALLVADTGSFNLAAARLDVHQTTVSRRVQSLERQLGAKLFLRRAYGMSLTAAGDSLIGRARAMENIAASVQSDVAGFDAQLRGLVKIAVPEGIGTYWLMPALAEFDAKYPDITLEVLTVVRPVKLLADGLDVSIAIERSNEPRVVAQRVGEAHYLLFASRKYLKQNGDPRTVDDLLGHRLVTTELYSNAAHLRWWNEQVSKTGRGSFSTNSPTLYLSALREAFGIGMLPAFYRLVAPDLMSLAIEPACSAGIWLAFHETAKQSARVRAVTEFIRTRFMRDRLQWFT